MIRSTFGNMPFAGHRTCAEWRFDPVGKTRFLSLGDAKLIASRAPKNEDARPVPTPSQDAADDSPDRFKSTVHDGSNAR